MKAEVSKAEAVIYWTFTVLTPMFLMPVRVLFSGRLPLSQTRRQIFITLSQIELTAFLLPMISKEWVCYTIHI